MLTYFLGSGVKMLTVADMGGGGVKNGQKVLTYFMDGPLRSDVSSQSVLISNVVLI